MAGRGRGFLLTGTDTGCGKTSVTLALMDRLREQGQAVWPVKPVASGAELVQGTLLSEDTRRLAENSRRDPATITFLTLVEPAAPAVAARLAGVFINLNTLVENIRECFQPDVLTLVEGVGGLLCPLTETETVADLAISLGIPLILVTRRSLGTLNHTLLTLEVAQHRGLKVAGVIVSEVEPVQGSAQLTCLEELRKRIAVPLLARLPYGYPVGSSRLSDCEQTDWWQLAGEPSSCKQ